MLSRLLLICCVAFHLNGLLSEEVLSSTTLLSLDAITASDAVFEGVFLYQDPDEHREDMNYDAASLRCKEVYNRSGVDVKLIQKVDYLYQLALQDDDFCYDKGNKCSKNFNLGRCEDEEWNDAMYTYCRAKCDLCQDPSLTPGAYRVGLRKLGDDIDNDWVWEDGSVLDLDDDIWEEGEPDRGDFCAEWRATDNNTNIGYMRGVDCRSGSVGTLCIITDINECEAETNPCGDAPCQNTVGGYECGSCIDGYEGANGICSDIDECATENPCPNDGACTNFIGGYECVVENSKGEMVTMVVNLEKGTVDSHIEGVSAYDVEDLQNCVAP